MATIGTEDPTFDPESLVISDDPEHVRLSHHSRFDSSGIILVFKIKSSVFQRKTPRAAEQGCGNRVDVN